MKSKFVWMGIVVVAVLAVAAAGAGYVFAQSPVSPDGYGPGWMMGGAAGATTDSMAAMHQWMTGTGGMHTAVANAIAKTLGLTRDQLTQALAGGQTLAQVAEAQGVSRTDLVAALETAHRDAFAQAVTDKILTQAQADTMLAQMAGRYDTMADTRLNAGTGTGRGMMNGAGRGMMGGTGTGRGMMGNWTPSSTAPKP